MAARRGPVSTAPAPWEVKGTFHDALYDWMERAPWLAISAAAHLLLFFLLSAIPWQQFRRRHASTFQARIQRLPEPIFEDTVEELEEVIVEEPTAEPELQEAELTEQESEEDESLLDSPDFAADELFESEAFNDVIGIGGGADGRFGGRFGGRQNLRRVAGAATQESLRDALLWLQAHQSPDGSWDADGFSEHCGRVGSSLCWGPGSAAHDVGITALALLAFLGDGNTTNEGEYRDVVARGIAWLRSQQDPDTGLIGERSSRAFLYDHALATLAICEAYYFSRSPLIRRNAQRAIELIIAARNPYGAWRYDMPPVGDSDTSVTGWMVFALASARDAGLEADYASAFDGALSWLDEVTDPASGRVGYDSFASPSARTTANAHYPTGKGEAMTAVGLLCRIFLGQEPGEFPVLHRHAQLLMSKPPVWDPDGFGCDMYYWYYGTYAMYQMGRPYWPGWEKAMKSAVLDSQRRDGDEKGSWDPVGPWGYSGGRVYSTALMALCLEVYFRYAQVMGAR